jgi:hypothetical protein
MLLEPGSTPGKEAMMSPACRVRVTGPLAMYADGLRADLADRGYAAGRLTGTCGPWRM